MGSQNLGAAGVVGCQPVGGGFGERARSQSGIDPSSVADQRQFGMYYTLTQSVMLS